jgi:multicomponent K+:H+ antiporter subunit D
MSDTWLIFMLLSTPGLPLLLAIPALRRRLRWPIHIALLPAIVLLFSVEDFSIELPGILTGHAGLAIDPVSRWWLAMSVVTWATSATFLRVSIGRGAGRRLTSLSLLTLAGQMGALLATDLAGFFTAMTLMSYAFVGLLIIDINEQARRAGRLYLVLLVVADIVLFEALLIAAGATDHLEYSAVTRGMAQSPSATLYMSMVITGFVLKTGFWPLHLWLAMAYDSVRPAVRLLLWVVPVTTALLGIVRWLPLGVITAPIFGMLLLGIGGAGIFYGLLSGLTGTQRNQVPVCIGMVATGIFAMFLGAGVARPYLWNQYGTLVPVFVAATGLGLTVAITNFLRLAKKDVNPTEASDPGAGLWFEQFQENIIYWGRRIGFYRLPAWRAGWIASWDGLWQTRKWHTVFDSWEHFLRRWSIAVTLFLFVGAAFVVLLMLDWRSAL